MCLQLGQEELGIELLTKETEDNPLYLLTHSSPIFYSWFDFLRFLKNSIH